MKSKTLKFLTGFIYYIYTLLSMCICWVPYRLVTGKDYFQSKYYTTFLEWMDKKRGVGK